jgi:hypothetical protein
MALPANGYVEVNGSGLFRGHLLGASGTFSGVWETDVLDVVDYINVRDGAVMAHLRVGPTIDLGGSLPDYYVAGTFPAYPDAYSMVSLRIPLNTWNVNFLTKVYVWRNGTVIYNAPWNDYTGQTTTHPVTGAPLIKELDPQYFEFIDILILDVPTTYIVYFDIGYANDAVHGVQRNVAVGGTNNSYEAMAAGSTPDLNCLFSYRRL